MNKTKNKWVVSAASAALVASAIVPVASAASFSDIENSDHKEAILALAEAGIISGYTDGTFKPNAVVTRGNVTKLLGKWLVSEGYEIPEDYNTVERFTDLPVDSADQELVKYAALVKDEGVFKGSNDKLMQANNMSREQMAVVLVRALKTVYGVDLVADYKAADFESKITDLDKANADENREAIIALEYAEITKVTAFNPKNSVTRGQFASFLHRAIENVGKEVATELKVESVTAVGAKNIEVKFTAPVDAKSTFEVKKGSAKVNVESVTLSADNKTAVIELAGKMTEGTYTVNTTSGEQKLEGSVTVTNEKVDAIEILSENAVLNSTGDAVTIGYQVKNQYGEDITKTTSLIANAAGTVVKDTPTVTQSKSTVTVGVKADAKEGDALTLTLVHAETGKSASKVVKVSAKSQVADITLGSLYNKDGKTLSETTDLAKDKFYVLVNAVDQYGAEVTADKLVTSGKDQNVVLSETNPLIADVKNTFETITVNGKDQVALQLDPASKLVVGETTVMAIATSTGKNSSLKITVAEGQRADKAVINTPELVVAGEKTFLPIEVTDKEGNVITDVKILKDAKRGVTLSGGSVTQKDWTTKDGKTGVYLDLANEKDATYKSIVAITASNETAIANISVKEAAKPVRIDGVTSDVKVTLLSGQATTINTAGVKVIDQYERELTNAQKTAIFANNAYELVITEEAGNDVVTVGADGKVTAHATKTGSEKVTVAIKKAGETNPISGSEKTITFRVTDGKEYVSYEVEKIGKIFDEVGAGLTDVADNGYTKEVKVYGVLDNGSKVELTAGTDYSVDAPAWLGATAGELNPTFDGTTTKVPYANADAKEVKTEVTVTINATGEKFTEEVTVSKEKPTVTSLKLVAEDTVAADEVYTSEDKTKFEDLKEVTAVDFTANTVAANVDFAVVDSYGVMRVLDNATIASGEYLSAIKLLVVPNTPNSVVIKNNNSATVTVDGLKANDFVKVTATVNGVEKQFVINGKETITVSSPFTGLGTLSGGADLVPAVKGVFEVTLGTTDITIDGQSFTYSSSASTPDQWNDANELKTLVEANSTLNVKYDVTVDQDKLVLTQKDGEENPTDVVVTGATSKTTTTGAAATPAKKAVLDITIKEVPADGTILTVGDKTIGFHTSGTLTSADEVINTTTSSTVEAIADAIEKLQLTGNVVIKAGATSGDAVVSFEAATAGTAGNSLEIK